MNNHSASAKKKDSLGILVLSCDKYSAFWKIFFERLNRFWPACDYNRYLLSNHGRYDDPLVETIAVGDDVDWSSNLKKAVSVIDEENILLMLDDAPLSEEVDSVVFNEIYRAFLDQGMNYINLKSSPAPQETIDDLYGELGPGLLYRTSLAPTIWKKSILLQILKDGESAWQFEINGSRRSDLLAGFYSTKSPAFKYLHCVVKGKIDLRAAKILEESGEIMGLDFPKMGRPQFVYIRIQEFRSFIFKCLVPDVFQRRVRSIFKI